MEDVLALSEKPLLESEPLVCVEDKPVVLHADLRPLLPMRPGRNCPARLRVQALRYRQPIYVAGSPKRGGTSPE
jgi:hypothetical protein